MHRYLKVLQPSVFDFFFFFNLSYDYHNVPTRHAQSVNWDGGVTTVAGFSGVLLFILFLYYVWWVCLVKAKLFVGSSLTFLTVFISLFLLLSMKKRKMNEPLPGQLAGTLFTLICWVLIQ